VSTDVMVAVVAVVWQPGGMAPRAQSGEVHSSHELVEIIIIYI